MKTPAEFEPIALWMGWRKRKLHVCSWWEDGKGIDLGAIETKTSLTDAEAVEAMRRLLEGECNYSLHGHKGGGRYLLEIFSAKRLGAYRSGLQPTISTAVEEALLKLIAAEGN